MHGNGHITKNAMPIPRQDKKHEKTRKKKKRYKILTYGIIKKIAVSPSFAHEFVELAVKVMKIVASSQIWVQSWNKKTNALSL